MDKMFENRLFFFVYVFSSGNWIQSEDLRFAASGGNVYKMQFSIISTIVNFCAYDSQLNAYFKLLSHIHIDILMEMWKTVLCWSEFELYCIATCAVFHIL